ncbi:MAG: hypothetical protein PWP24_1444 [Clostridiales bacterium]|nr:hypothetical protein [Clostridiales bacterium]
MKAFFEKIKANSLWMDLFNLFAGILLIVVIVLFCLFPGNKAVISLLFLLTGIMNLSNGVIKYKKKETRSTAMVLIMISMVTFTVGIVFLAQ